MSDLHLVFIGLGIFLFVLIVGGSYLQKRNAEDRLNSKSTRQTKNKSEKRDPEFLRGDTSKENKSRSKNDRSPVNRIAAKDPLTKSSTRQEPTVPPDQAIDESMLQVVETSDIPLKSSTQPAEKITPQKDRRTDSLVTELVAKIKNPNPLEQQELLALFRKYDFKFNRNVHVFGLNELTDMWRDVEFELPSARFTELGIAIQLADKDGAMSKKELHDYQQMVLAFTTAFDAPFEFSMDIDAALQQAKALDQLGRRYDSMAVLNVVPKSRSGFRLADIESCARDLLMSVDKNGIFMKTKGQKHNLSVLYRLACTDGSGHFGVNRASGTNIHDLVAYLNVPATVEPEDVFHEMVNDVNSLATWLEGKVVDRNGRVMTQRSYSTLLQQISDIAFSMRQDGLTPGGSVAKKLF